MNRAYAGRLWREGTWPCLVTAVLLCFSNILLLASGGHSELMRISPGPLTQSSRAEIGLGLVTLGLPVLVLILSVRGLAAECGRGSLRYLVVQVVSRRELAFTLWAVRALQIASVLLVSLAPDLFRFPFLLLAGTFLWLFIKVFIFFASVEFLGILAGGLWRGVLILFPGLWALQIMYSILQRVYHWPLSEPLSYAQNHWLYVPVMASAGANLQHAVVVSLCWFLVCLIPAVLCGEWLEHAPIRARIT